MQEFQKIKQKQCKLFLKEIRSTKNTVATICELEIIKFHPKENQMKLIISSIFSKIFYNMFSTDQIFQPIHTNNQEVKNMSMRHFTHLLIM